jgi:N-acetylneuraminic acid mutarotase
MNVARMEPRASVLLTGKILMAGGVSLARNWDNVKTAELYDPLSGNWTVVGSMTSARGYHTASVLLDGKVLVVGGTSYGYDGDAINTAELYDPLSGNWVNTGNMTTRRKYHTACVLLDGKVLVVGGGNYNYKWNTVNTAELYDSLSGNWTDVSDMTIGREHHTASVLLDGKVLVVGGYNGDNTLRTAELYDPLSGNWTNVGNMTTARRFHTASVLLDGKVLVVGGYNGDYTLGTAEVYNPLFGNWTNVGNMITARRYHAASVLSDGKVLVVGGFNGRNTLNTAELYDPSLGIWILTESMIYSLRNPVAVKLLDGKVLVIGKYYNTPLYSGELYYP